MTIEEYAELERVTGGSVHRIGSMWWQKVRTLFYRPLLPFKTFDPDNVCRESIRSGVFQHAVKDGASYNSFLNLCMFLHPQEYSLESLNKKARGKITRAERKHLEIVEITQETPLVDSAFKVFVSFHDRTQYSYRSDRVKRAAFVNWYNTLLTFPGPEIHGVLLGEQLISFYVTCLVEDVFVFKSTVNSRKALSLHAADYGLHFQRSRAANEGNIKMLYAGRLLQSDGINRFKIERGAEILALPAYIHIHPFFLKSIKVLKKETFQRILGLNKEELMLRISSVKE